MEHRCTRQAGPLLPLLFCSFRTTEQYLCIYSKICPKCQFTPNSHKSSLLVMDMMHLWHFLKAVSYFYILIRSRLTNLLCDDSSFDFLVKQQKTLNMKILHMTKFPPLCLVQNHWPSWHLQAPLLHSPYVTPFSWAHCSAIRMTKHRKLSPFKKKSIVENILKHCFL